MNGVCVALSVCPYQNAEQVHVGKGSRQEVLRMGKELACSDTIASFPSDFHTFFLGNCFSQTKKEKMHLFFPFSHFASCTLLK